MKYLCIKTYLNSGYHSVHPLFEKDKFYYGEIKSQEAALKPGLENILKMIDEDQYESIFSLDAKSGLYFLEWFTPITRIRSQKIDFILHAPF